MIKIKKEHIKRAEETYYKNKVYYLRGNSFFKNISEKERIKVFAEMFAECDKKIKYFEKKYPKGFPEIKEMEFELGEIEYNPGEIGWGFN